MRLAALFPVLFVGLVLAVAVCLYPYMNESDDAIAWPALSSYYNRDFREAGFRIRCETTTRTQCTVQWTNPIDPKAAAIDAYRIGIEQDVRRDEVLPRFYRQVEAVAGEPEARRVTAVLDAFFQSGLRRLADRGVRRAASRVESFQFPPFRLAASRIIGRREVRDVDGIDASYSTILTGLPKRPAYRADVYASAGTTSDTVSTVRIVPSQGACSTRVLDPASNLICTALHPGAEGAALPCKKIDITVCDPQKDFQCRNPVLQLHALAPGVTMVRGGASPIGRPLVRGALELAADEMVILRQEDGRFEPIHVETNAPYQDFRVELVYGSRAPLSRQRMVNGRWERWYEPTVRPWVEPLVNRWDQLARGDVKTLDAKAPVILALDLNLQRALEDRLAEWMRTNVEKRVVQHLIDFHYNAKGRRDIDLRPGERQHRRAVPQAGVTVLDAETGRILAVASYPPAKAFTTRNGEPAIAPGWRERFGGSAAPDWARRQILEVLTDRISEDTNANFVTHPIGSTFKPILLSLMIDTAPPGGGSDSLASLFDLVVAGHPAAPSPGQPLECPACAAVEHQATAGLPLGPWGSEDGGGTHRGDPWIDRADFIVSSCNKYAITLGVLSMLDWSKQRNDAACCWNATRDRFAFVPSFDVNGPWPAPAPNQIVSSPQALPPVGPWLDARTVSTNASFPEAPVFRRLRGYYDVSSRSQPNAYDPQPWAPCVMPNAATNTQTPPMGTVVRTQLMLTGQPIGPAFTNLFTGAGHNWWTNVKLAEAYARLASNRAIQARFCGDPAANATKLFQWDERYQDLAHILSRQKTAPWVRIDKIETWLRGAPDHRGTLSKTGTSLRSAGYQSTGIFAIYIGNATVGPDGHALGGGKGIVVVAHVDEVAWKDPGKKEVGGSEAVTMLVNSLFRTLSTRLEP
ncbi:MAG: hypothetical protein ABI779_13855 [Acidobacteriota bacterium]